MKRPRQLADRRVELGAGIVLFALSTWLIWDAYEGRGRPRPFLAKLLP
jgi:hypothetical protein